MGMELKAVLKVGPKIVQEKDADPWCLAFAAYMHGNRFSGISLSAPDVNNTSRSTAVLWRVNGGSGIDTFGPVVGIGTTTPAFSDHNLGTKIAHGTSTGLLSYGSVTFNAPQTVGYDRYFEVVRVFTNLSGASITVYEIGLIGYSGAYYFLLCRDVIGAGIEIPNNQALTLIYKIKISL